MPRHNSKPQHYRLTVTLPSGQAQMWINKGTCVRADPPLAHCVGASAAWIKGMLMYQHWPATMRVLDPQDALL